MRAISFVAGGPLSASGQADATLTGVNRLMPKLSTVSSIYRVFLVSQSLTCVFTISALKIPTRSRHVRPKDSSIR